MKRRLLASALLAALVLSLIATLDAVLDEPQAERLPIVPPEASALVSSELLREFAGFAYADLAEEDWGGLALSLLPGSEETCGVDSLAIHAGNAQREAAEAVEAAIAREDAGRVQLVRLPSVEWRIAGMDVEGDEATVQRHAHALGRASVPPLTQADRWSIADGAWWLDPESVAPGCGSEVREENVSGPGYVSEEGGSFERPQAPGTSIRAVSPEGHALTVALVEAERGVSPEPPQPGYEHVFAEVRVESADGSQLGLPLRFNAASFDGWFLRESGPVGTEVCPGTEHTGVTCQLISGYYLVKSDDPSPRLAWTLTQPGERTVALAWWRLPTTERDGATAVHDLTPEETARVLEAAAIPSDAWSTDFSRVASDLSDAVVVSDGRSGIPVITQPRYETINQADGWLIGREPVLAAFAGGEARAYPLRLLLWHEAVNDWLGGLPLLATYCPRCNSAAVYERTAGTLTLQFRAASVTRSENRVLFDEATESWWQQSNGASIAGGLAGLRLPPAASAVISWDDFKRAYPSGTVLSQASGFDIDYGFNPYFNADLTQPPPSAGETDPRLPARARVLGLRNEGDGLAVPFSALGFSRAVNLMIGGQPAAVFWQRGTTSALSSAHVAQGRDVGAAVAFDARLEGRTLTFRAERGSFVDEQTGSTWSITGEATSGPLVDSRLDVLPHVNSFWSCWAAFRPETSVYAPS
ncbi:MAG: DUF3179 domain-containing protein [Chloroflexota bacterium]|nr:DUF3179 domain-containing protein [Chloroflexota bacterium]MDE2886059.1 DUF3179 domain-containing protein [Chloroflexota bacterium]